MADGCYIVPPLPAVITRLIKSSKLSYLATSEDNQPHLCLMNFSYLRDPELSEIGGENGVIVMSTRRNTKKFQALLSNPNVAVLLHDFSAGSSLEDTESACSVTVYGTVSIMDGAKAEELRASHLSANPLYPQFILGDDIAIFCITPTQARMCDITDKVTMWHSTLHCP
jgi:nitroimidazol reductase NimA-like FMN-containing flavoprotein (pyridoxamine 5'-phosphate oxidase superfamily)